MNLNLLALGHAEVFFEFDGPAVNLAVDRFGHGWLLLFAVVLSHFTLPFLRLGLFGAASADTDPVVVLGFDLLLVAEMLPS